MLPMPRQYGIGRRAPTRAVLSCAASWCVVVRRIHGLWNMPPVRFVLCALAFYKGNMIDCVPYLKIRARLLSNNFTKKSDLFDTVSNVSTIII